MERLNRGVVAVRTSSSQVYIGWRLFGNDPAGIGFNVYRNSTLLNATPITNSTNYVDNISTNSAYTVRPVINGVEQAASEAASVWSQNYLNIPLQIPAGGTTPSGEAYTYNVNDCSVGDLDGDGDYEFIVKWDPSNAKDNSQSGYTGNVYLDAYQINGTRLWRINLGRNIRAGAHYTQFLVYDFDGDGKAELACKTADGTVDGAGTVIGSASADHRNASGYILTGPEYLTVFNGQTGAAMATTNYLPARGTVSSWGDNYGNRVDRFIAAVAYLDGQRPSMVFGRGYYTRMVRVAWDWRNGSLTHRWTFDSNTSGNSAYAGQGNHQMTVGDTDGDGRDEVFNGSSAVNDNGSGMWVNGLGHGDALHMSDMNPDRAGQEIWQPYESPGSNGQIGAALIDARTGARIFTVAEASSDVGRGLAADVDPRYKGYEMWASRGNLYTCTGTSITTAKPSINFAVWWDADLQRELLDNISITKWNYSSNNSSTLLTASGCASNNGTKATPALSGDVLGDWREEVILRTTDNSALRIFTTTTVASNRIYTLMHDPQYRVAIAWQNAAYNQPPHPGFYLGGDMPAPPVPNIYFPGSSSGSTVTIQENTTGFCSVDGTIDNNNAGFTGTGFCNSSNAAGSGINWRISAPAAGSYTISWRYSNGGGSDRPASLLLNGSTAAASISFPATADWTTWTSASTVVNLNAGNTDIRLQATGAGGLANIDNINIQGAAAVSGVSCAAVVTASTNLTAASASDISIAPNPSSYAFIVNAPGNFRYGVYDQLGRLVEKGNGQFKTQIGQRLPLGTYTVQIEMGNKRETIKIIKAN
ncbi:carbohydrate-binding protein [Longitalea luteola]|uniref:rhamnogalacturonan lyase family protein n=1 Tax=Longitalea luteola TaxID=2812563 RepID=UPI00272E6546|nr:carbohydrate-binding protein [Longitalea luteola]